MAEKDWGQPDNEWADAAIRMVAALLEELQSRDRGLGQAVQERLNAEANAATGASWGAAQIAAGIVAAITA